MSGTRKPIEPLILTVRGKKVIRDSDLAAACGVETRGLNQAVKRNADRFPEDFMIQMSADEWDSLRSQIATLNEESGLRSQTVTLKTGRGQHRKYLPYAFSEHGAIMAASVLNSPKAVEMSVFVVRAFVKMREQLAANAEILRRLAEIDKTLLEHNDALRTIWNQLRPLLVPPDPPKKGRIGFDARIQ